MQQSVQDHCWLVGSRVNVGEHEQRLYNLQMELRTMQVVLPVDV